LISKTFSIDEENVQMRRKGKRYGYNITAGGNFGK
jgi:hypothetical protein